PVRPREPRSPRAPAPPRPRATSRRTSVGPSRTRRGIPRRSAPRAERARSLRPPQLEPEVSPRREREQIGKLADPRELRLPEHLDGNPALVLVQVELDRLRRARDVVDAQDDVVLPRPDVGEDAGVLRLERLVG